MISSKKLQEKSDAAASGDRLSIPILPRDFCSATYLEINKDVAQAGVDPAVHYVYEGYAEGRVYRYPEGESPEELEAEA